MKACWKTSRNGRIYGGAEVELVASFVGLDEAAEGGREGGSIVTGSATGTIGFDCAIVAGEGCGCVVAGGGATETGG